MESYHAVAEKEFYEKTTFPTKFEFLKFEYSTEQTTTKWN